MISAGTLTGEFALAGGFSTAGKDTGETCDPSPYLGCVVHVIEENRPTIIAARRCMYQFTHAGWVDKYTFHVDVKVIRRNAAAPLVYALHVTYPTGHVSRTKFISQDKANSWFQMGRPNAYSPSYFRFQEPLLATTAATSLPFAMRKVSPPNGMLVSGSERIDIHSWDATLTSSSVSMFIYQQIQFVYGSADPYSNYGGQSFGFSVRVTGDLTPVF